MPEWTPAKVAVVVLVAVTLLLGIIQFFPERSTRNFAATAVETAQLQCTNVNLAAYEGLQTSVKTDDGFSGGAYSPIGGVFIEGHLTNTSPNEIFLIFDTNISPISAGFADSTIISDASRWSRTLMEVKGSPLAKNWNQNHGYFIASGQTVEFKLMASRFEVDPAEKNNLAISWNFVDLESLTEKRTNPVINFERTGSSLVWSESEIYWRQPTAEYHPEFRVP
ncbi:MAG TPA: hypothetical protein EYG09_01670 [Dehalococcoidia bacterium]|nr:hypothetical protein [Dehalococcoidia bacterium]